jgi:hypothetical protein
VTNVHFAILVGMWIYPRDKVCRYHEVIRIRMNGIPDAEQHRNGAHHVRNLRRHCVSRHNTNNRWNESVCKSMACNLNQIINK